MGVAPIQEGRMVMVMSKRMSIRDHVVELCEALDPHHQGLAWPDPIEWDGRPLERQASDMIALARSITKYGPREGSAVDLPRLRLAIKRLGRRLRENARRRRDQAFVEGGGS